MRTRVAGGNTHAHTPNKDAGTHTKDVAAAANTHTHTTHTHTHILTCTPHTRPHTKEGSGGGANPPEVWDLCVRTQRVVKEEGGVERRILDVVSTPPAPVLRRYVCGERCGSQSLSVTSKATLNLLSCVCGEGCGSQQ